MIQRYLCQGALGHCLGQAELLVEDQVHLNCFSILAEMVVKQFGKSSWIHPGILLCNILHREITLVNILEAAWVMELVEKNKREFDSAIGIGTCHKGHSILQSF